MNVEFIADTVPALREIPFVLLISSTHLLGFGDRKEMESKNSIVLH